MRLLSLSLASVLALALVAAHRAPAAAQQPPAASPCADSLYQVLRARPLVDLSEREYEYFMQREKACTDYQTLNRLVDRSGAAAPAPAPSGRPATETFTRGNSMGRGVDVYVRNLSDRAIIVNSVRVYDCQGIRDTSCGMHYPKAKLLPGQSRRVLTIRFREDEAARYRYEYNTSSAEG
ncbi:MAG TPA: hypothetical protein VHG51_11940 [Longimicrobiaceae bacterium]|nr:hypothetical protein [Longimicrobiaceae bacterium]